MLKPLGPGAGAGLGTATRCGFTDVGVSVRCRCCVRERRAVVGGLWDRTRQHSLLERPSLWRLSRWEWCHRGPSCPGAHLTARKPSPHASSVPSHSRPRCVYGFPSGRKENRLHKPRAVVKGQWGIVGQGSGFVVKGEL